jgi:prepilin-type N-terminal cleavage/methylation domain-containing protein
MSRPPRPSPRHTLAAFTLVELLVVIGIIAILISILLPTLTRARESSNRTKCLSNMRSIYQLLKIYEVTYRGCSPLGMGGVECQANYFLSRGPDPRYVAMGQVIAAGLVKVGGVGQTNNATAGTVFYCPSQQGSLWADFDVPSNPWPPLNPYFTNTGGSDTHGCRMSYNERPIDLGVRQPTGRYLVNRIYYATSGPPGPYPMFYNWPTGGKANIASPPATTGPYPILAKLKNAAILSDVNVEANRLRMGHKKGINVLYNNGGAKWVDNGSRFDFGSGYNQSVGEIIFGQTGFGSGYDAVQIQLWLMLDQI